LDPSPPLERAHFLFAAGMRVTLLKKKERRNRNKKNGNIYPRKRNRFYYSLSWWWSDEHEVVLPTTTTTAFFVLGSRCVAPISIHFLIFFFGKHSSHPVNGEKEKGNH
jgi:hypothetical protein